MCEDYHHYQWENYSQMRWQKPTEHRQMITQLIIDYFGQLHKLRHQNKVEM